MTRISASFWGLVLTLIVLSISNTASAFPAQRGLSNLNGIPTIVPASQSHDAVHAHSSLQTITSRDQMPAMDEVELFDRIIKVVFQDNPRLKWQKHFHFNYEGHTIEFKEALAQDVAMKGKSFTAVKYDGEAYPGLPYVMRKMPRGTNIEQLSKRLADAKSEDSNPKRDLSAMMAQDLPDHNINADGASAAIHALPAGVLDELDELVHHILNYEPSEVDKPLLIKLNRHSDRHINKGTNLSTQNKTTTG